MTSQVDLAMSVCLSGS